MRAGALNDDLGRRQWFESGIEHLSQPQRLTKFLSWCPPRGVTSPRGIASSDASGRLVRGGVNECQCVMRVKRPS
jgi:hypothetical protein